MIEPLAEKAENLGCAGRRAGELSVALQLLIEQKDQSLVYWHELTQQGVFVNATPIDIGPVLNEFLFPATPSVVMTSATLSVAGGFEYCETRSECRRRAGNCCCVRHSSMSGRP